MDPVAAQRATFDLNDDAGQRWWCACGRSQNQPFCDGAHRGSGITPVRVERREPGKGWYNHAESTCVADSLPGSGSSV